MKKIIILLIMAVLAVGVYAQEDNNALSKFYGGVRVGFTASQISGDDLVGFNQLGGTAGLFVNHAVIPSGRLKLQLELNFTMKGSYSTTPKNQVAENFYSLRLGYVEMPLMLIWTAGKWSLWGQKFQFDLEIGPDFGVNVFAVEREANGKIIGPPFRRFEFSGIGGITLNIAEHHSANFRYNVSIIPVRKPAWGRVYKNQHSSVLTFSYCYQF